MRAARAHLQPWRIAPLSPVTLEVHVAEQEVPDPPWSIVAVEPIAIVEPDVAEQGDLHAETDARADLQVEGPDLAAQVPDVTGIEEKQTVQRVRNRELLLEREQREITAARVTDSRDARGVLAV